MACILDRVTTSHTPESLAQSLRTEPGLMLLRSGLATSTRPPYSILVARPFLILRTFGTQCQWNDGRRTTLQFGNPWRILESALARFEWLNPPETPFPLGGCFGYWGYDLKSFVESKLPRRAADDLALPDGFWGFYGSCVVFDHCRKETWIVATGINPSGVSNAGRAREQRAFWRNRLNRPLEASSEQRPLGRRLPPCHALVDRSRHGGSLLPQGLSSNTERDHFIEAVRKVQRYIRAGDVYQVNLSHRIGAGLRLPGWDVYQGLLRVSPAPYAAYLDAGQFQLASASPELFLRIDGEGVLTQPIKGTRPRGRDPDSDARLARELFESPKDRAELLMITDLLRNDLGKCCQYGSIQVPDLARLEQFSHVQHLVSTVTGRLREDYSPIKALEACFPGGSITGAPKIRAMEIIDELEPITRGPYTGCIGYVGFNRRSQWSIAIRTAIITPQAVYFPVGAGIVADSEPEAEYDETLAKAHGFLEAYESCLK